MFAEIWLRILLIRKRKELLAHFAQAPPDIHTVKNQKTITYSHQDASHFSTGWEIDMEVVDGLIHAEEFEKKHYEAFLLKKLVEDKKSFV